MSSDADETGADETGAVAEPAGTADTDGGYVHRPSDWDGDDRPSDVADDRPSGAADGEEGLGRAGWVLVGVVVVAFLVVPGAIYLYPAAPARLGLRFFAAMLVLPFVPAFLLGVTAVWSLAVGRDRR
ncbi:hypothetical protein [Candidatus Halobonum tyrrellensis]|uniref:Uncharacterized protein n=1 Tax=Candidatus Halobonum tyrrellensis G22 TaxID=1324957 RepID=V4HDX4_9EURY|nr:hypothetical protein [Candidatus Halobonum tyrrellensis]ESP88268.1 hypothetical protein K933_09906 [Candidatus Halobonum tyrrellensis G22]